MLILFFSLRYLTFSRTKLCFLFHLDNLKANIGGRESACRGHESHCRGLRWLAKAVRVTVEAVRVLLEAVRVIIEAREITTI
jgi:hypothetical protein